MLLGENHFVKVWEANWSPKFHFIHRLIVRYEAHIEAPEVD